MSSNNVINLHGNKEDVASALEELSALARDEGWQGFCIVANKRDGSCYLDSAGGVAGLRMVGTLHYAAHDIQCAIQAALDKDKR